MMTAFFNVIKRPFYGNRISGVQVSDNFPIGEFRLGALDNIEPEDPVARLKRLRKELDRAIEFLEGDASPSGVAQSPPPPPRLVKMGLLTNPWMGFVEVVRGKDVPARQGGGMVRLYEIQTGAARFVTFDRNTAAQAHYAFLDGCQVQVWWKEWQKGRHINYDVHGLRVLPPHGNIGP